MREGGKQFGLTLPIAPGLLATIQPPARAGHADGSRPGGVIL